MGAVESALALIPYDPEAPADPFQLAIEAFYEEALGRLRSAQEELEGARLRFGRLMEFLAGSYREPQEFFLMLADFAFELDQAVQLEHAKTVVAERRRKEAEERAAQQGAQQVLGGRGVRVRSSASSASSMMRSSLQSTGSTSTAANNAGGSKAALLANIRAYQRLSPELRRALLTEQGAKDRLRRLQITARHSMQDTEALQWLLRTEVQERRVKVKAPASTARKRRHGKGRVGSVSPLPLVPTADSARELEPAALARVVASGGVAMPGLSGPRVPRLDLAGIARSTSEWPDPLLTATVPQQLDEINRILCRLGSHQLCGRGVFKGRRLLWPPTCPA